MSDLHYTSQDVSNAISNAEQLSLALITIVESTSNWDALGDSIKPLLIKLHDDLERTSSIHTCVQLGLREPST